MKRIKRGKILRILTESPELISFVENVDHIDLVKLATSNDLSQLPSSLLEEVQLGISRELEVDVFTGLIHLLCYLVDLTPLELSLVLKLGKEKAKEEGSA